MSHPSNSLAKNTYLISATTTDVSATPKQGKFFSIACTVGGTVKVKGGGVYESTDTFLNYIDPNTGAAFADDAAMNTRGDGFYERIGTVETDIVMTAGQTVYGRFDSLKSDGTFTGFAYT